ncbi:MAG: polyketide synthase dehydratase domain-containing protein [Planctomycetaceae bacterium]|nr:polyketide synthase dehydratase domain-containing protein [Planctomycetaceae bacterium]
MLAGNANQPSRRWPQAIAIVGLACRVPGAKTADEFWQNLLAERDTLCELSESELRAAGVSAAQLRDPRYVRIAPLLDDYDCFDAALFRCSPREAAWMDPQHRVFLETAWEALEDAGYDPFRYPGAIGLFAGAGGSVSSNLFAESAKFADYLGGTASVPQLGNDKDFLPSRVSYKLNLRGPAVNVQTACSTSLVAVHFACQSLLSGESDMALAGGVCVRVPQRVGYVAREGDVVSPTGRCRPFSAAADGTVFGNGAGLVVLKTLNRALADGDRIYAVIRGSAINNDGGDKLSYTASSVAGQIQCVRAALAAAGVEHSTIGYVEAHGTATLLGDPLEVDALNQAYGDGKHHRCGIGSFKGNIGHLEAAAGVIGLIKTALALDQQVIPASIHCESPSPRIQFAAGPFHVVQHAQPWTRSAQPRRAAVNGLGVGGTNAHVVLEEAPLREALATITGEAVLCLSADQPETLVELVQRYVDHFDAQRELNWHDVCFTAATGRAILDHRLAVCARSLGEAREHLQRWLQEPPANCVLSTNAALAQIAARFVDDGQVSLDSVTPLGYQPRRVKLPSYPFARERHWVQASSPLDHESPTPRAALLGEPRYSPATEETAYHAEFGLAEVPFLRHHRIYDRVIVPGATYLALLLTARGEHAGELTDIEFIRPLALAEHERVRLQLSLVRRETGEEFAVYSQSLNEADSGEWSEQVRATLSSVSAACVAPRLDDNSGEPVDPRQIYARFRELGLALDATFQTVQCTADQFFKISRKRSSLLVW